MAGTEKTPMPTRRTLLAAAALAPGLAAAQELMRLTTHIVAPGEA